MKLQKVNGEYLLTITMPHGAKHGIKCGSLALAFVYLNYYVAATR